MIRYGMVWYVRQHIAIQRPDLQLFPASHSTLVGISVRSNVSAVSQSTRASIDSIITALTAPLASTTTTMMMMTKTNLTPNAMPRHHGCPNQIKSYQTRRRQSSPAACIALSNLPIYKYLLYPAYLPVARRLDRPPDQLPRIRWDQADG